MSVVAVTIKTKIHIHDGTPKSILRAVKDALARDDMPELDEMMVIYSFFRSVADRLLSVFFFFSSRRRHTRCYRDWSSDVCSSDLAARALSSAGWSKRRCR